MLKLLITGLIVYYLYRKFFASPGLGSGPNREEKKINNTVEKNKDIEYTDYEEID